MATVKVFPIEDENFTYYIFPIAGLDEATNYKSGSKEFKAYFDDDTVVRITGSGFKYDGEKPIAGTVKKIETLHDGKVASSISGLSISAKALADAALSETAADDAKIMDKALRGDDSFSGGPGFDEHFGGKGDDEMFGGKGDDYLHGEAGNDTLEGGKGYDGFVFDTKLSSDNNVDTITDFKVKVDTVWLREDIFKALDRVPEFDDNTRIDLDDDAFWANRSGKAHDETDRIIYDKTDGHLYYDPDGTGDKKAVQFADLDAYLKISAHDFQIFV